MPVKAGERIAYYNGEYLPEREVRIPFRDRGFLMGDAVFDTARSFGGKIFRLEVHIERLFRSLAYLRIDPGLSPREIAGITEEVFARNLPHLGPGEDYWVTQHITRGMNGPDLGPASKQPATVVIDCTPLPLAARARHFAEGIRVFVPSVRRIGPESLSPRAKTHNYLNLVLGDLEAKARDDGAWAVLLDREGHLTEGMGSNLFLVRGGRLMTPPAARVLPGVTRGVVLELAAAEGIPAEERDLDLYDAAAAEEAFLTSTSLCICPVSEIAARRLPEGERGPAGPVTRRLMEGFKKLVQCDFEAQYLARLTSGSL